MADELTVILYGNRANAHRLIDDAPAGSVVKFTPPRPSSRPTSRSTPSSRGCSPHHARRQFVPNLEYSLLIALACASLASCGKPVEPPRTNGALRIALERECLANLPAGPQSTRYNDWDEVVAQCSTNAYYLAVSCVGNEAQCFAMLAERGKAGGL